MKHLVLVVLAAAIDGGSSFAGEPYFLIPDQVTDRLIRTGPIPRTLSVLAVMT